MVLLYPRWFLSWLPARRAGAEPQQAHRRADHPDERARRSSVRAAIESPRQLDGDLIEPGHEIHAECLHGRLLVRVPR